MRGLCIVCFAGCVAEPQVVPTDVPVELEAPSLWVSGYHSAAVLRIDAQTGEEVQRIEPVPGAQSMHRGPDGALYVVAEKRHAVLRWADGELTDFVVDDQRTLEDETGGLRHPTSAVFGADGTLYVGGFGSNSVHRYNADTGAFIDVFSEDIEGMNGPDAGMQFGPDGHLYVPAFDGDQVVVLHGTTGEVVRRLASIGKPRGMAFDDQGALWVASWADSALVRFGADGSRLDVPTIAAPAGLALAEDGVWLTSDQSQIIALVDPVDGSVVRSFDGEALGINGATFVSW